MLKKMMAVLLLISFSNVYAFTPINQTQLTRTFDNLNYRLNVEWDQKDAKFFDSAIADFEKEIGALQKEGLTKEELINFTVGKVKDQQVKDEINELSKVVNELQMTDKEARAFVVSKLNSTYAHGASWSGSRFGRHTAFLIGIIIVIILINHNDDDDSSTRIDECQNGYPHTYPQTLTPVCYDSFTSNPCCPPVLY